MCVAAFAWQAHPRWLLVAIGNRDEFHARPAAPLDRWEDESGIIAGRDLQSGGTWLGVSQRGSFALVTNLRGHGMPDPKYASRGALVTDQLTGQGVYGDPDTARLDDFNPFNLIVANPSEARFLSNRPRDIRSALAHGIYGLSNGTLDEPWPKTLQLKASLLDWITQDNTDLEVLFATLASTSLPGVGVAADQPSDVAQEADDTPVFIRHAIYGTRCSSVVAIERSGAGAIVERRFDAQGDQSGETAFDFRWEL